MTEWRSQLLYFADVFWRARPACCNAVVSGGIGSVICWSLWCLLSRVVRSVGVGLAGRVGCVVEGVVGAAGVEGVGCCPLSVGLVRSDKVRAEMACWIVVEGP